MIKLFFIISPFLWTKTNRFCLDYFDLFDALYSVINTMIYIHIYIYIERESIDTITSIIRIYEFKKRSSS